MVPGKVRITVNFTPYGGEVRRNEEVVQTVQISLRPYPCGKIHRGGGGELVVDLLLLKSRKRGGAY